LQQANFNVNFQYCDRNDCCVLREKAVVEYKIQAYFGAPLIKEGLSTKTHFIKPQLVKERLCFAGIVCSVLRVAAESNREELGSSIEHQPERELLVVSLKPPPPPNMHCGERF